MNSLSWMLYAASVVEGLQIVVAIIMVASAIVTSVLCIAGGVIRMDPYGDDIAKSNGLLELALYRAAPVFVVAGLVGAAIPSTNTVYAIAASEMGEEVLTSKTGNKAMQALDAWLDRQIAGEDVE